MPGRSMLGWLRWSPLVAVLAISVGAKLALLRPDRLTDATARQEQTQDRVDSFLHDHGFEPSSSPGNLPGTQGSRGPCTVTVVILAPDGWQSDMVKRLAGPGDRAQYLYGSSLLREQPVWRTWYAYHWRRLSRYLGHDPGVQPVFGVIESGGCTEGEIDWSQL